MGDTLTAKTIGEAENALRANLSKILRGSGLEYAHWVALQIITHSAAPMTISELRLALVKAAKISDDNANKIGDDLQRQGIVSITHNVFALTKQGTTTITVLSNEVQAVTKQAFANIESNDLAIAHRVLSTVIEQANALL